MKTDKFFTAVVLCLVIFFWESNALALWSPLEGPKVKGYQIGMQKDEIMTLLLKHIEQLNEFIPLDEGDGKGYRIVRDDGKILIVNNKDKFSGLGAIRLTFDSEEFLTSYFLGLECSAVLFNSEEMLPEDFARTFMNSYGIERMDAYGSGFDLTWIYVDSNSIKTSISVFKTVWVESLMSNGRSFD